MTFRIADNIVPPDWRKQIWDYVSAAGWEHGWKSNVKLDQFGFLHKHYAGGRKSDHNKGITDADCTEELRGRHPLLHEFWTRLKLEGHTLVRCYANGMPYGSDGMVHTDSQDPNAYTIIYYPAERWSPNWGGETIFYNKEETDLVGAVYPKPGRLLMFSGVVPHRAGGVSRICPTLRITLMFKTVMNGGKVQDVPDPARSGDDPPLGPSVSGTLEGGPRPITGLGKP